MTCKRTWLWILALLACATSSIHAAQTTRAPTVCTSTNSPAAGGTGSPIPWVSNSGCSASNNPWPCCTGNGSGTCTGEGAFLGGGNDKRAIASGVSTNRRTEWLYCRGFGFTESEVPTGAVVAGIWATVEGQRQLAGITLNSAVRLVPASGTIPGSPTKSNGTAWTANDVLYSVPCVGSPTCSTVQNDTWGTQWTAADIQDADFGVAVSILNTGSSNTVRVDAVQLTVVSPPPDRIAIAGFDAEITGAANFEDWTPGVAGSSAVTVNTAVKRTGQNGVYINGAANNKAQLCNTAIDSSVNDRLWMRGYLTQHSSDVILPNDTSAIIASLTQCDGSGSCSPGVPGCYAKLINTGGTYSVYVGYHGRESTDLNVGTFTLAPFPVGAGTAFTLGQSRSNQNVTCDLIMDTGGRYTDEVNFSVNAATDCSAGNCDIVGACWGTPAINAVGNYASFGALKLGIDDVVLDTKDDPGVGYVKPLAVTGNGGTQDWSGTCGGTAWGCEDEWPASASGACISGSDWRSRNSSGIDLFTHASIGTLGGSDLIRSVRGLVSICSDSGTTFNSRVRWLSGATSANGVSVSTGNSITPLSDLLTSNPNGGVAFTATTLDALQVGYEKVDTAGTGRGEAVLLEADVQTPSPLSDWVVQDVSTLR